MTSGSIPAPRSDSAEIALARRLRRAIHRHPELGHHEHRTADYVERALLGFGLRPFRPAPTSVAAVAGPPGRRPIVGFRADLDGLPITEETNTPYSSRVPGVMHACGHDGHTAALLLLARRLAIAPPRRGPALLVFQQAEEAHPSGAPAVLRELPEVLLPPRFHALHLWPELPAGTIGIHSGPVLASVAGLTVRVTGRTGRAHGTRADGDGTDAIAVGIRVYKALAPDGTGRQLNDRRRFAVFLGRFEGGEQPHRTPTHCEINGTLRALSWADQDTAAAGIRHTVDVVAAETEAAIDVIIESGIRPPVRNSALAVERVVAACRSTGIPWLHYPNEPLGVSDDFGWYLQDREGAFVLLGCGMGEDHPSLHTPRFDFDEAILPAAVDMLEALTW